MTTADKGSDFHGSSGALPEIVNSNLLYHHCVIPSQQILHVVEGSFTIPNANDIVVFRHRQLELWTLYPGSGKLECIHSVPLFTDVFAAVAVATGMAVQGTGSGGSGRSYSRLRKENIAGSVLSNESSSFQDSEISQARDGIHYLAVTSETGYVTLLRYELADPPLPTQMLVSREGGVGRIARETGRGSGDESSRVDEVPSLPNAITAVMTTSLRGRFVKVSEVLLGRSGVRATVPGMRMTVGENGSALFISAFMRSKVVVPINRTNTGISDWRTVEDMEEDEVQEGEERGEYDPDRRFKEEENDGFLFGSDEPEDKKGDRTEWRRKRPRSGLARGVIELGSPIEVHRQTVIYSICAIEGSAETALFAALEEEVMEPTEAPFPTASSRAITNTNTNQNMAIPSNNNNSSSSTNTGVFIKMPPSEETATVSAAPRTTRRKTLVVYAYVASLKQVQRTHLIYPPASAHRLISLPAAPVGPGGVLVCTDEEIIWYDVSTALGDSAFSTTSKNTTSELGVGSTGIFRCSTPFPRRVDFPDINYDPSIISHALTIVQKVDYFLLLQDEHGDVYRVSISNIGVGATKNAFRLKKQYLATASKGAPGPFPPISIKNPLAVHYYETLPCAKAMVLFRSGFLFVASDGGAQHGLFRVKEGYLNEKEYMVRRIKLLVHSRPMTGDTILSSSVKVEEKDGRKAISSSSGNSHGSGSGGAPHLPPPSSSLPPPSLSKGLAPSIPTSRTIVTFHPHHRPRHLDLVQSFMNTPPIVGLCCTIPGNSLNDGGNRTRKGCIGGGTFSMNNGSNVEGEIKNRSEPPEHQQQQVQLAAVCGRGPQSLLLHARYGYSTREVVKADLPGIFFFMVPLSSSTSLQDYYLLQRTIMQEVREASRRLRQQPSLTATGDGSRHMNVGSHSHNATAMIKRALTALNMVNSQYAVGTDKVVFSTLKTTSVFSIGEGITPDISSGFETAERTLAVGTIEGGRGYIQVTPTALHAISSPFSASSLLAALNTTSLPPHYPPPPLVEATKWVHPKGRQIIAAAVTSRSAVLSFAGGGLASFYFQLPTKKNSDCTVSVFRSASSLWVLTQRDMVATFPTVSCVSVLQPPLSAMSDTASHELRTYLSLQLSSSTQRSFSQGIELGDSMHSPAELVAVATVATKEVQLFHPSNLRQALTVIPSPAGVDPRTDIRSVLLTYMNDGLESADGNRISSTARNTGGAERDSGLFGRSSTPHRVFCFIGYSDGTLVRCELDSFSMRVIDRQELSCGSKPCQLHAGDGESVCYIQSGEQYWRCAVRGGVVKVMPWRFPCSQTTFGYFSMPRRPVSLQHLFEKILKMIQRGHTLKGSKDGVARTSNDEETEEREVDEAQDNDIDSLHFASLSLAGSGGGRRVASGSNEEYVIALRERQLCLFSSSLMDDGPASNSLEYSLVSKILPLAGRRIVRHPTQPSYVLIAGTEHRFHRSPLCQPASCAQPSSGEGRDAQRHPLPLHKRSLGKPQVYHSSLQLYHEEVNQLLSPLFLSEGEAIMSIAIGSFFRDMGKEPIVVIGVARQFSHGILCGSASTYKDGLLRAFRFVPNTGSSALDPYGKPFLRLEPLHHTYILDVALNSSPSLPSSAYTSPPDYPSSLFVCEEVGLLIVGLGKENGLRLYSYGRSQFLRKRCLTNVPARITAIQVMFVKPSTGVPDQSYFVSGLYQCPADNSEALRCAREKQMLIVCGTEADSVFIAALQPGSRSSIMGFLMIVARDPVPRFLSCMALVNESTIAVADRFGTVAFLFIPPQIRTGFAEPIDALTDTEVDAIIHHYAARQQLLEEVAVHHTGALVTSLNVQEYDPSGGEDPSLTTKVVYYGTILGSVGCYTPFITEEDGALAAYLRPLLREHMRLLLHPGLGQLPYHYLQHRSGRGVHHVFEGQWLEAFRQSSASVFSARRKAQLEERLERIRVVEAARRDRLGLPPRKLPLIDELVAKQRALSTLPL